MVSFGEKAKIKKAGNLNQGRSYVITTVCSWLQTEIEVPYFFPTVLFGHEITITTGLKQFLWI